MACPGVPVACAPAACAGTGAEGEQWWAAAFQEATQHLNYSLAADAAPWAIMVGGAVRRSQHQLHLRIDDLEMELDLFQELGQLAASGELSTNARQGAGQVEPSGGRQAGGCIRSRSLLMAPCSQLPPSCGWLPMRSSWQPACHAQHASAAGLRLQWRE